MIYKTEVTALNWPCGRDSSARFGAETGRKRGCCSWSKNRVENDSCGVVFEMYTSVLRRWDPGRRVK